MQIPILNGIYSSGADFRTSYPVNLIPVPKENGISRGYLRPAEGIVETAIILEDEFEKIFPRPIPTKPIRGSYYWNGSAFFVSGRNLYKQNSDGTYLVLTGLEDNDKPVSFAHSFDRLCIASGGNLYYLSGDGLAQVTDEDIGTVNHVVYVDGYFLVTDGEFIVATELNSPTSVNPFSYGSSEIDPDPIMQLLVNRNELHAINRYTIEVFANTGGTPFPFARIGGAHIQKGSIGQHTACVFMDAIAFLGSGHGEPPAVYIGENAQTLKISTREIDQILKGYTEEELAGAFVESRVTDGHKFLYIHLKDQTLVYDGAATLVLNEPVWFRLMSTKNDLGIYRARHFVWDGQDWICGDPTSARVCKLVTNHGLHYDEAVRTEFGTMITWSETGGAIIHNLELIALTGNVEVGKDPLISASYTGDGETWSQDRPIKVGTTGNRMKRLVWFTQGMIYNWRAYRFRSTSDAHVSFARLEMNAEALIP